MKKTLLYQYFTNQLKPNKCSTKQWTPDKMFAKVFSKSNEIHSNTRSSNHVEKPFHHTLLYKDKLVEQVTNKVFSSLTSCKYTRRHVHNLCKDKISYDKINITDMSQLEYLSYQNKLVHDILFMIRM